jgi:hypothetical protein
MEKLIIVNSVATVMFAILLSPNSFAKENEDTRWGKYPMGHMMMGPSMMGTRGGMAGMCPMSMLDNVKVTVSEVKDGVTLTYTAKDKKDIVRIQKMAQIMKLSQDLEEEDTPKK